jgi:serine/threonine-protein kinase
VVEGSVRKDGQNLLIIAQLISTTDGFHMWSGRYQRELKDVLAIQREISESIADTLRIRLSASIGRSFARRHTDNLEAYTLYLQAHARLGKRTREGMIQGWQLFARVLELQPDYTPALAGSAMTQILLTQYELVHGAEVLPRARQTAIEAVRIDPEMAEARTALAWIKGWFDWDHAGSEAEFRRALVLCPGWPTAHQWYGEYLTVLGRPREGLEEIHRARKIDPISPVVNSILAFALFHGRRFAEAIEQCQRTLEMDSDFLMTHYFMALAYQHLGSLDRAIEELEKTRELWAPEGYSLEQAVLLAAAGRHAEVHSILDELRSKSYVAHDYSALNLALIYAALGNQDAAFHQLDVSYTDRCHALLYLNVDPRFDDLRPDARFGALLRKMRL